MLGLDKRTDCRILLSWQGDDRSFNRGAMKNLGFMAVKKMYPADYRRITIVFNDLDTMPYAPILNYETTPGTVRHFYGNTTSLGGIVSITGQDFERVGGFPNFWGWGMEDNVLNRRCLDSGLVVDRSNFYQIGRPEIMQLFDGITRSIRTNEIHTLRNNPEHLDGLAQLRQWTYLVGNNYGQFAQEPLMTEWPSNMTIVQHLTFETDVPDNTDHKRTYSLISRTLSQPAPTTTPFTATNPSTMQNRHSQHQPMSHIQHQNQQNQDIFHGWRHKPVMLRRPPGQKW
jgi:hypothetical protein